MVEAIRAAGGEVFGVTSEPQTLASEAREAWETGFPCVGDPHHEIREDCRARGYVDLFANEHLEHLGQRSWVSHPKGFFQPGVLAIDREGRVLYRWRCRPANSNMNGAGHRPEPAYVWERIQAQIAADGPEPELDESPVFKGRHPPWPLFVALLLAHGWFVRLKTFPLARPGDRPSADPRRMFARLFLFVAAWIAAFVMLPAAWVAPAFLAWALVAAVAYVRHRGHFQRVSAVD